MSIILILTSIMCVTAYIISLTNLSEGTAIIVILLFSILLSILNAIFEYNRLHK